MGQNVWGVDAFASRRFRGNPAAVCRLDGPADEAWMQAVAAEFNLSETAFVTPVEGAWMLRWFTPATEVALCGHATLASAHALWSSGAAPAGPIVFRTLKSGDLICRQTGDGAISMDFPALAPQPAAPPAGLVEALGVEAVNVERTAFDFLVEAPDAAAVEGLRPNLTALAALPARGVMVTARGTDPWDFVSRFFAPAVGVPEDPVTGSAHCSLAPYWARRLGKTRLRAWQASRRGGEVAMDLNGARVALSGHAVTVWEGRLLP